MILQLTVQLETAIPDMEFLKIRKRNLRAEIRKEFVHFEIAHLAHLIEFILRLELLDEELNKSRITKFSLRHISEIDGYELDDDIVDQMN